MQVFIAEQVCVKEKTNKVFMVCGLVITLYKVTLPHTHIVALTHMHTPFAHTSTLLPTNHLTNGLPTGAAAFPPPSATPILSLMGTGTALVFSTAVCVNVNPTSSASPRPSRTWCHQTTGKSSHNDDSRFWHAVAQRIKQVQDIVC